MHKPLLPTAFAIPLRETTLAKDTVKIGYSGPPFNGHTVGDGFRKSNFLTFILATSLAFLFFYAYDDFAIAQETPGSISPNYPYALETPEARRFRIQNERLVVREYIARAKAGSLSTPNADEIARQREKYLTEQALNDSSLQKGDIVSTGKYLFLFRGRNDSPRVPEDFVQLPSNSTDLLHHEKR